MAGWSLELSWWCWLSSILSGGRFLLLMVFSGTSKCVWDFFIKERELLAVLGELNTEIGSSPTKTPPTDAPWFTVSGPFTLCPDHRCWRCQGGARAGLSGGGGEGWGGPGGRWSGSHTAAWEALVGRVHVPKMLVAWLSAPRLAMQVLLVGVCGLESGLTGLWQDQEGSVCQKSQVRLPLVFTREA